MRVKLTTIFEVRNINIIKNNLDRTKDIDTDIEILFDKKMKSKKFIAGI